MVAPFIVGCEFRLAQRNEPSGFQNVQVLDLLANRFYHFFEREMKQCQIAEQLGVRKKTRSRLQNRLQLVSKQ